MLVLGLEGSANKLGIAVYDSEALSSDCILSNERITYNGPIGEGFILRDIQAYFSDNIHDLLKRSLNVCGKKMKDMELICYTQGPGIGTSLNLVAQFSKTLAMTLDIPIVGVNHCVAHIEMGRFITKLNDPTVLYVSGANTQVISYKNNKYHIHGEALDVAIGNCLDKIARILQIPNDPSPGYNIEQLAKKGELLFDSITNTIKGMDIALSGITTIIKTKGLAAIESGQYSIEDICMSIQEYLFSDLTEITERAMSDSNSDGLIVVGGVGCNERLQKMLTIMCNDRGAKLGCMDDKYCIDNGAMIAHTGYLMYKHSTDKSAFIPENVTVDQRFRTDQVHISWRE
ncbi:MAG: hypothetical protein MHMPM18_000696 [Marteilia pararefringens]